MRKWAFGPELIDKLLNEKYFKTKTNAEILIQFNIIIINGEKLIKIWELSALWLRNITQLSDSYHSQLHQLHSTPSELTLFHASYFSNK